MLFLVAIKWEAAIEFEKKACSFVAWGGFAGCRIYSSMVGERIGTCRIRSAVGFVGRGVVLGEKVSRREM